MGFGDFLGSVIGGVGSLVKTVAETTFDVVESTVSGLCGVAKTVCEGVTEVCKAAGPALLPIAQVAISLVPPGSSLFKILSVCKVVGEVAQALNIGGTDSPTELGMKMEIADKKPNYFETTKEYLNYLNKEINLDVNAVNNLTDENKASYGLMGAALDMGVALDECGVKLTPAFVNDVATLDLPKEEIGAYVKGLVDSGVTNMQDMTNYMRREPLESDKSTVYSSIMGTMRELYPELSDSQLDDKLCEMEDKLRNYNA